MVVDSEAPKTEAEILRRGAALLADRLPAGWSTRTAKVDADELVDGLVDVIDANGESATLVVEARRIVEGRDIGPLRDQLEVNALRFPGGQGVVMARYLSPPVRERLAEAGLSYVDATGNLRVEIQTPGLFVFDRGADRDPWRGPGRPRGTLKGAPAAKIVRAVADLPGPWTIRELVAVSSASTGATYRVVEYLEREGLAERSEDGLVNVSDWADVLRRWSSDYGFVRNSRITRWIAPRGLGDLIQRIGSSSEVPRYAVTGAFAAAEWAPYAPARMAMVYVASATEAAESWGLRPAEAGANVMLGEPEFEVVFDRTQESNADVTIAAPAQVVVDLMTGPGRSPSEAEELLRWMKENEQSWRH